mgnify:CR=1 FL=1
MHFCINTSNFCRFSSQQFLFQNFDITLLKQNFLLFRFRLIPGLYDEWFGRYQCLYGTFANIAIAIFLQSVKVRHSLKNKGLILYTNNLKLANLKGLNVPFLNIFTLSESDKGHWRCGQNIYAIYCHAHWWPNKISTALMMHTLSPCYDPRRKARY